jgi:hypothetical protein
MARDLEDVVIQIKNIYGYPSFADFISSDPDRRTVMYRRFNFLSARNLLNFQSELSKLEVQLLAFDWEDFQKAKGSEFDDTKGDWNLLQEKARDATSMEKQRLDLIMRIYEVLEKYSKLIAMALAG